MEIKKRDIRNELRNALTKVKEQMEGKKKLMTWEELLNEIDNDLEITPALAAKIEQARQEHREGKTLKFESASAAQKWMDEL